MHKQFVVLLTVCRTTCGHRRSEDVGAYQMELSQQHGEFRVARKAAAEAHLRPLEKPADGQRHDHRTRSSRVRNSPYCTSS